MRNNFSADPNIGVLVMTGKDKLANIMNMSMSTEKLKDTAESDFLHIDGAYFPTFSELKKATILMAESVKNWEQQGNKIVLQTEGAFYRKRFFYRFFDFRPTYDRLDKTRNICVTLTICGEDTFRLQAAQGFSVSERKTHMLTDDYMKPCDYTINDTPDKITISTEKMTIEITKKPWSLVVYDAKGKAIYRQMGVEEHSFMMFESTPFGFLFDVEKDDVYACDTVYFSDTEHFYGMGERFAPIDQKGQNVTLWQTNALGTNTNRAYKTIPYFMSTAGYGVFFNTSYRMNCNMGANHYKAYSLMSADSEIDQFIMVDPDMKKLLRRYCDITGSPAMPPDWTFGFWISKISYETQQEVEALAERLQKEDIPCDVIHIDTNWYKDNWVCDFVFCDKKFPNPEEMIKKLREKGIRITLWQMPYIDKGENTFEVYNEGFQKGYFAFRGDAGDDFRHGLIDFSNPDAVEWYKNKLLRPLLEMGVAAIKVDFGESAPAFYQYASYNGDEMHNLYPLLYNKVCFDITTEIHGVEEGVVWARSAWAGSQRYPVHWGGDSGTDFMALAASIKAGLSFGMSGFPFWSHDIGGFFYETNPRLYVRWMQVGVFTSHARAHGFFTREPWDFGQEALDISRKYLKLRYRLLPYIISQAQTCVEEAIPMMRAMILEFQNDPNLYNMDNQYMFGDYFLVAPVIDEGDSRQVYLPAGTWTDYWSKEVIEGNCWITVDAGLDTLPLYIRENAIIPEGPDMNFVDDYSKLTLDIYPVKPGTETFDFYYKNKCYPITMVVENNVAKVSANIPGLEIELRSNNYKAILN